MGRDMLEKISDVFKIENIPFTFVMISPFLAHAVEGKFSIIHLFSGFVGFFYLCNKLFIDDGYVD
jgi:hypothetical protein